MSEHWDHISFVIGFDPRRLGDHGCYPERSYPQREGVQRRLGELRALPHGWDGYNGRAVTDKTAARVHAVLAACLSPTGRYPSIVPGSSGDVQIEWHWGGVDLEIGISDDGPLTAWLAFGKTGPDGVTETLDMRDVQC
ncbi:hypothetical protein OIU34_19185 [Pararhizobium sp. BT-229]|uniref:hypothetical protein n=1 Tax=Pararhizobium sp. BT-229 TaxID=2986923 RepID=UPI0021F76975|nr:hypothetical protein [Pararhizobium sp. BT-229]MCV9964007.1 hypothetical protein [Pararhizobium sp. BT-229]